MCVYSIYIYICISCELWLLWMLWAGTLGPEKNGNIWQLTWHLNRSESWLHLGTLEPWPLGRLWTSSPSANSAKQSFVHGQVSSLFLGSHSGFLRAQLEANFWRQSGVDGTNHQHSSSLSFQEIKKSPWKIRIVQACHVWLLEGILINHHKPAPNVAETCLFCHCASHWGWFLGIYGTNRPTNLMLIIACSQ